MGYYVTQVPLFGTVVDFWRLLDDQESFNVVYFTSKAEQKVGIPIPCIRMNNQ